MAKKTEQTKSTKEAKQTKSMKKTETAKNTAADKSARGASKSIDTDKLVFGLDIGTRSIVGTVGYREGNNFHVLGQESKEHETRAMLDGQIHDIGAVSNSIVYVKHKLEEKLGITLANVCIAAAGRVLKTEVVSVNMELDEEKTISAEDVARLTAMGVEQAYERFLKENDTGLKFFCVGSSVIRYYLNGYQIGNLENHKAHTIGCDMIATFLPEDVVDGLYKAVEMSGLRVVNMTLEPIAAISVAIPENYRMLNIGLVDVGAGTSDICITKDGCVVAYGMIPVAGDKLTEIIAQNYLVDFNTAETIKCGISDSETVEYKDIMGLPQKVGRDEVLKLLDPQIEEMADLVAEKFKELNGGKPVSAVFVVGGGGTVEGYTKKLSEHLGIMAERVAVRGEEVMGHIIYQDDVKKDSRLVTPVGICLNYYDQSSNFIYVTFNDQHIKLYDGGNLAVVDAAMHADFPNDGLFPKRGEAINYRINGKQAMKRGLPGDPAVITVNGEEADMHTPIRANDVIRVKESTVGEKAKVALSELPEFKSMITVYTNQSKILLPKFAEVNGEIKTGYYEIEDGDDIVMRNYYTLREVREFMDVILDESMAVLVNNEPADDDTKVFENFNIKWGIKEQILKDYEEIKAKNAAAQEEAERNAASKAAENAERSDAVFSSGEADGDLSDASDFDDDASDSDAAADSFDNLPEDDGEVEIKRPVREETEKKEEEATVIPRSIIVNVNGADVKLEGKESYVFVDVFDRINFDLKNVQGSRVVTELNGRPAMYMEQLNSGDHIVIKWEN